MKASLLERTWLRARMLNPSLTVCGSGSYLALPELDGLVRDAQDQLHLVWGVALSV